MSQTFLDGRVTLHPGDCLAVLAEMEPESFDSCVTDPPYHLTSIVKRFAGAAADRESFAANNPTSAYRSLSRGFMGQQWDGGDVAFRPETWAAVLRALKPGAHLLAFSGTRTYHRMVCAIEDAGFEVRDCIFWHYGSGFPKSRNVSKDIDKSLGANGEIVASGAPVKRMIPGADQNRDGSWIKDNGRVYQPGEYVPTTPEAAAWHGWGTALKPSTEPICLARKPLSESSVAANVLAHGTGAINVDGCRVGMMTPAEVARSGTSTKADGWGMKPKSWKGECREPAGRWPANLAHDGSEEVLAGFPVERKSGTDKGERGSGGIWSPSSGKPCGPQYGDSGSAARFFYTAKADAHDRIGSKHPTVKPIDLMQWLVRLVTPKGGMVLDPFAGTGTTGEAAFREGMRAALIEREAEYQADIARRMELAGNPSKRAAAAKDGLQRAEGTPLFGADQFDFGDANA